MLFIWKNLFNIQSFVPYGIHILLKKCCPDIQSLESLFCKGLPPSIWKFASFMKISCVSSFRYGHIKSRCFSIRWKDWTGRRWRYWAVVSKSTNWRVLLLLPKHVLSPSRYLDCACVLIPTCGKSCVCDYTCKHLCAQHDIGRIQSTIRISREHHAFSVNDATFTVQLAVLLDAVILS